MLVQICQDHKNEIDRNIISLVNDVNLATNAKFQNDILNPIAIALDQSQKDKTTIAIAVEIWHKLIEDLKFAPNSVKTKVLKRRDINAISVSSKFKNKKHCNY